MSGKRIFAVTERCIFWDRAKAATHIPTCRHECVRRKREFITFHGSGALIAHTFASATADGREGFTTAADGADVTNRPRELSFCNYN